MRGIAGMGFFVVPVRPCRSFPRLMEGFAIPTFLTSTASEIQFWHRDVAGRLRSGSYTRLVVESLGGLYEVRGVRPDGTTGAVLAKYRRWGRAHDAVNLVTRLAIAGED